MKKETAPRALRANTAKTVTAAPRTPAFDVRNMPRRNWRNITSELPAGCDDIAAIYADASVTAPLNAAQYLEFEKWAMRYRCTVGELIVSLAFFQIQQFALVPTGDNPEQFQDAAIIEALLEYADAGRTPKGCHDFNLPPEITPGPVDDTVNLLRAHHDGDLPQVAYVAGDADAFDKADKADRIAEALKPWKK